jgi:hygromycin-B 7''-O-kinase
MIPQDTYVQPDAPDPVLDPQTVLGLVRRHLSGAVAVTAVDESGGEARAYAIDDGYIVKTQRPHRLRPRTSLEKEVFYLNHLAERAPELVVPRVLGHGREGSVEYTLMSRVPGTPLRNVVLEGAPRRAVLFELGRILNRLHTLPLPPFEDIGLLPGDKDEGDVQVRIERGLRQAAETIATQDEALAAEIDLDTLISRLLDSAPMDARRAALHSNPGPEHVFVDPSTLRFRGLIDFGDSYISHPTLDLRRWTASADRVGLLGGYGAQGGVDDAFRRTLNIVQLGVLLETIAINSARRRAALQELRALIAEI